METVKAIIQQRGGMARLRDNPLKIKSPPYMDLCIECVGSMSIGDASGQQVSIAHYYIQSGDSMADPDLVMFVPDDGGEWLPVEYTQHSAGIYQRIQWLPNGKCSTPWLLNQLTAFAKVWNLNLKNQGFADTDVEQSATA